MYYFSGDHVLLTPIGKINNFSSSPYCSFEYKFPVDFQKVIGFYVGILYFLNLCVLPLRLGFLNPYAFKYMQTFTGKGFKYENRLQT